MRVMLLAGVTTLLLAASTFDQEIENWRHQREASLKADEGWLTVAGLFWLHEGQNPVGSGASNAIRLPRGPDRLGVFEFHDGKTAFHPAAGFAGTVPPTLRSDTDGGPDLVRSGDFTMFVIHRGDRYAIRLKDNQSEFRKAFTGLHWYPPRKDYRIEAEWVAYAQPKILTVPNILGETEQQPSPGYAVFKVDGRECQLHPVLEDNRLFFIFKDRTSGKGTYPSGRFLYADMPSNGHVTLDFNKAYNPPCAFTPYATCPLPPAQNRLAVSLEAGELDYGHHSTQ